MDVARQNRTIRAYSGVRTIFVMDTKRFLGGETLHVAAYDESTEEEGAKVHVESFRHSVRRPRT